MFDFYQVGLDDIFNPTIHFTDYRQIVLNQKTFITLKGPISKLLVKTEPICGTYILLNTFTGHFYIGSSSRLYSRINGHKLKLKHNQHTNKKLQESINVSSINYLDVCYIFTKDKEESLDVEQNLLNLYFKNPFCTNQLAYSRSSLGYIVSQEHKEKISKTLSGKSHSKEWNKKVSESKKNTKNITHCFNNSILLRKPIVIHGITYPSLAEAARQLNVAINSISYKLKSKNFSDCYYI